MEIAEFLAARFADDEARARRMLTEVWPEEVVVQVGDENREPCVTVGPQVAPKAYLRVWRPGTENQIEYGWQAHGVQVWGADAAARVLAECEAKRQIVKRARHDYAKYDGERIVELADYVLRALAAPYADHADYREEWKV
jgi:hypothetical protein